MEDFCKRLKGGMRIASSESKQFQVRSKEISGRSCISMLSNCFRETRFPTNHCGWRIKVETLKKQSHRSMDSQQNNMFSTVPMSYLPFLAYNFVSLCNLIIAFLRSFKWLALHIQ